ALRHLPIPCVPKPLGPAGGFPRARLTAPWHRAKVLFRNCYADGVRPRGSLRHDANRLGGEEAMHTSKGRRFCSLFAVVSILVAAVGAPDADAITIERNFIEPGQTFPGSNLVAGTPEAHTIGSGNIQDIFGAAADMWQSALGDKYTMTLSFGWYDLPDRGNG